MRALAGVRAVIFDMDGVLWHSERAHAEAFHVALSPLGITPPPYPEIAGRKTSEVIQWILERHGVAASPSRIAALAQAKQAAAHLALRDHPPLSDGCVEVLRELARWHTLALASSASARSVNLFLEITGARGLFAAVVTGDDVVQAKPSPEIYLEALHRLAEPAESTVVIEDAPSGIRAARRAGLRTIALAGTCTHEQLLSEDVVAVMNGLRELL